MLLSSSSQEKHHWLRAGVRVWVNSVIAWLRFFRISTSGQVRSICGSPNCEQPVPPSQICANPAGEEAQSSGARSKFGAVPSSNFPCILSFMHLRRPWLLEKLQTESSRRALGGQRWQGRVAVGKEEHPQAKKSWRPTSCSWTHPRLQSLCSDLVPIHTEGDRVRPLLIWDAASTRSRQRVNCGRSDND